MLTISGKIRVGNDYQADVPEAMAQPQENHYAYLNADQALLVWSPPIDIAESKVEEFIKLANERHGYNAEQALGERKSVSSSVSTLTLWDLGMLLYHRHNFEKATTDLANYVPFRDDEWSKDDQQLFDQALQLHAKKFHAIQKMVEKFEDIYEQKLIFLRGFLASR